jgi:hypothetical protein
MKKIKIQMHFSRKVEVNRILEKLQKENFPRIQMSFLVLITLGMSLLISYSLLSMGINSLWLRYFCTCIGAYGIFLFLLWLWIRTRIEDFSGLENISELPSVDLSSINLSANLVELGSGGEFGGGGSSSSFGESPEVESSFFQSVDNPVVEAVGAAGEAEEFAVPLIILILLVTVILSSVFVIYSAPILFAELLLDSLLAAGLYKKLRGAEESNWFPTAIRRTIIPMLITTFVFTLSGYILQSYLPKANSLGDAIKMIQKSE